MWCEASRFYCSSKLDCSRWGGDKQTDLLTVIIQRKAKLLLLCYRCYFFIMEEYLQQAWTKDSLTFGESCTTFCLFTCCYISGRSNGTKHSSKRTNTRKDTTFSAKESALPSAGRGGVGEHASSWWTSSQLPVLSSTRIGRYQSN